MSAIAAGLLNPTVWLVIALACSLGWGAFEHKDAELQAQKAGNAQLQLEAVGSALGRQNAAVDRLAKLGAAARQKGAQAQAAADQVKVSKQGEITALQAMLTATNAAKPGELAKTCSDAAAKVREAL